MAKRSVFVVGTDGLVRYRWVTEDALVLPPRREALGVLLRETGKGDEYATIGSDT